MSDEILPPLGDLPEEESPLKKTLKKAFIMVIAILLIFLFSTYLLGYYAFDYFSSQSESDEINELTFEDAGKIIIFEEEVYRELQEIYFSNLEHEFKVCLFGEIKDNTYSITGLVEPEIFSQSPFHVSAEPCAPEAIVDIHSHPFKKCIASAQDISYLERLKQRNPMALMAVMCAQDRMSFYV